MKFKKFLFGSILLGVSIASQIAPQSRIKKNLVEKIEINTIHCEEGPRYCGIEVFAKFDKKNLPRSAFAYLYTLNISKDKKDTTENNFDYNYHNIGLGFSACFYYDNPGKLDINKYGGQPFYINIYENSTDRQRSNSGYSLRPCGNFLGKGMGHFPMKKDLPYLPKSDGLPSWMK